jgi:predicted TIM-barrel fold metal-dependent hydrolase
VLIKWIPAIMDIDPSDKALKPYYRKLVELDLPLLIHVGQERSFGPARDEFGDPVKLNLPLNMGVTVIAAHIATTGESEGEPNFDRILPMFRRYPNLYTEISSLTQINKLGYLSSALQDSDLQDRMLYGTDWPLQFFPLVSPWFQINYVSNDRLKSIQSIKNQWDRDVALKLAMGVPESVFFRTRQLLKLD